MDAERACILAERRPVEADAVPVVRRDELLAPS
jgi:hypothetical protein